MSHRWKVLLITSVGVFMGSLDLFIVNIAFPDLAKDFSGASLAELSWVLNAYAIVFAALLVPAGRIADRVGRRRVFILGLLLFVGASTLCALAPAIEALIAARILQAAGAAMMIPATLGLILPVFPVEQRAMAIGLWSSAGGLAAALGPPIGGLLVQISWRWIFVVNVPIGIVTAIAAARMLQEVREPDEANPDLVGAALLAVGIGLLTLGIVKGPEWGWTAGQTLASFAGALALILVFLRRCATQRAPVIELPLLRIRSFALGNLALVFFASFGAMVLSTILLLTEVWGYSSLHAGIALALSPAVSALTAIPSGKLGGKIGQRPIAAAGGIAFAAGVAYMLLAVNPEPEYAAALLPGFVLTGAGTGMVIGTLPAVATGSLPPSRFATGTAIFSMARQLGTAIGVAVLIALLTSSDGLLDGLHHVWWFALGAGVATTALALAVPSGALQRGPVELAPQRAA